MGSGEAPGRQPHFNESGLSASPPGWVDQCGERLMTESEVRNEIYIAITEHIGYEVRPLLESLQASDKLATAVFDALKAKALLNLDVVVD